MVWFAHITDALYYFEFYYPMFMAYLWMIGTVYYHLHWESKPWKNIDEAPTSIACPPASFIVPCHNEARNINETIDYLCRQDYPEFEIIAVNDGSTDETGALLDQLVSIFFTWIKGGKYSP